VKGRRYWYFQTSSESGRAQRYVGPETPELLERISRHNEAKSDERERTSLVSALVRQGMPRPRPDIAKVVTAFAYAGAFRLGSVLVGTIAYQAYAAMLHAKLPIGSMQTGDVAIAQFANRSTRVADKITMSTLELLRSVIRPSAKFPTSLPIKSLFDMRPAVACASTSSRPIQGRIRTSRCCCLRCRHMPSHFVFSTI
jgi:hypothetical protein